MDASSLPRSPALAQARAWADQKRWDRVHALTPELLAQNPESLEAHKLATRASINCGHHREATKMAKTCVQMGPNSADAHYLAAVAASNIGLVSIAHQHIKTALNLAPNWATLHQFQARLYLRGKHMEKALAALREAQRLAPDSAEINGELIQLESTGNFLPEEVNATTQRYENALALDPGDAALNFKFGQHLLNLVGDYPRALQCLGTALRANPGNLNYRRAYFLALRHTDPVYRCLNAPLRWAVAVRRILAKLRMPGWEKLVVFLFVIPLYFAMVIFLLSYFFFSALPAKLYELLTITDIRAQAMGRDVGEISRWSWRRLKLWQRGLLFGLIICVPWLLLGLFIWGTTVFVTLLGVVVVLAWLDFIWQLWGWFRLGWRERRTAVSRTIIRGLILLFLFGLILASYRDKVTPEFFDILLFYFTLAALYTSYKVRFKDKGEW